MNREISVEKNDVYKISFKEYALSKDKIKHDTHSLIGEIQGKNITAINKSDKLFWNAVGDALRMPKEKLEEISNSNWFRDEITSLKWLDYGREFNSYYLVFFGGIPNVKQEDYNYYISLLKDTISFWQNEADDVYAGTGKRDFTVYIVSE